LSQGEDPMIATKIILALTAVVLLVGLAGFTGAVLASFRVKKVEGRPVKAYDPTAELIVTGALCGSAGGSVIICVTSLTGWLNVAL
jgi:hypothetical protein